MRNKRKTLDMTEGSIVKSLLLFAVPLLVSSVIQQMYNTVDLLFAGNFIGTEAQSAVGAGSMMITCIIGLFSGLAVGTNVVLSRIFGAKDMKKLKKGIHTAVYISIVGGIFLTIIGEIGAEYFLKLIHTPENIISEALSYIRIYLISITSMLIYNICSGIVRAGGDSNTPMIIQFAGGLINILSNAVFIAVLDLGIRGAAIATFFSQTVAAVLIIIYLVKDKGCFNLDFKCLALDTRILKEIFYVGIPAGIQSLVITLSNVVVQSYINALGVDSIAAFTCYLKLELLIYYPIMAIGQSIMTFAGQNIGAYKMERMKKGTILCIICGICLTIVTSITVLTFGEFLFGLFNSDVIVISKGMDIIKITFPFYFVYVVLEVLSCAVRGSGKSIPPMIIILSNICVLRVILLYFIVPHINNVQGIAVTYPITWITTSACMIAFYIYNNKKLEEVIENTH